MSSKDAVKSIRPLSTRELQGLPERFWWKEIQEDGDHYLHLMQTSPQNNDLHVATVQVVYSHRKVDHCLGFYSEDPISRHSSIGDACAAIEKAVRRRRELALAGSL